MVSKNSCKHMNGNKDYIYIYIFVYCSQLVRFHYDVIQWCFKVTLFNLLCLTIWNEYMSSLDVNTTRFECC